MSLAKRLVLVPREEGTSVIYRVNKIGDKHEPWGTPANMECELEKVLSTRTLKALFSKKDFTMLTR